MAAWMEGERSHVREFPKRISQRKAERRLKIKDPNIGLKPDMLPKQKEKQEQDHEGEEEDVDVDLSEVYFLIMHFLAGGPCTRATGQLWNELLQHKLLPRRYHAWFSRSGMRSTDEDDDGVSFPLSYIQVVERNPAIEKNHLVKLLRQQLLASRRAVAPHAALHSRIPTAADVPTLLGFGPFSLLNSEPTIGREEASGMFRELRWPHWHVNQVHGLALRELGGGFSRFHRSPSIRAASYAIMKPSVLVQKIQIIKKFRGHRNVVYCAIFDRSGQHIITGSDDRLVKIWSTETGFCLRSCRGHEGDITELSVSSGNTLVASASNDFTIRVWRLPDGLPLSVLRGHTGAVTAISFSPRQNCEHHILSSSEDGTCRIWDARDSLVKSRVYMPNPELMSSTGKSNISTQPIQQAVAQISCCAFNVDGSIFVTGSCDKFARVWDARKWHDEITGKPNYELDILKGHENAVNYVQFSGCAGPVKPSVFDTAKEEGTTKFKNSCLTRDSIVTCSRDGSAIIWICKPRKKVVGRYGHWVKSYHLHVPPPPMPLHPPRGGGPRQRFLPTPRGVNMIVWSLDNRFVLAAIMDCRICVWNAVDGSLVHSLTGHTQSTYVVDVHPFNPRIAMSAGYDGRIIIWDIWEGRPVRVYETGDFRIVDGSFSPDGTSLVVSDEVGQVYLLTTGQGQTQKDAKYDQFFLGDFRPLVRDVHGNLLDQETQIPPHQRNIQDLLCDADMIPYEEPYQSMYQQRRLGALGIDWQPLRINLAVGIDDMNYVAFGDHSLAFHPNFHGSPVDNTEDGARWVEQPTDADEEMDWEQDMTKLSDDSGSDYSVSEEVLSLLDDDEQTASSTEVLGHSDDEGDDDAEETAQDAQLRRSKRNKRKTEGVSSPSFRRKVQKLPSDVEPGSDRSEAGVDKRSLRQRQCDVESSTARLKSPSQLARPKRLAAKNALQLFSHINTNEGDDEASSTHCETSSYSSGQENQENESDGLLSDLPCENDGCPRGQEKEVVLEREELSQSFGKDMMGMNDTIATEIEDAETENRPENDGDENCGSNEKQGMIYHKVGSSSKDENSEDFELTTRDNKTKKDTISDMPEVGSSSKRPKPQRRLVLKLKKNAIEVKRTVSKEDLEDTDSEGGNVTPKVDQLVHSGESTKRKLRRLIVKPPQAATPVPDSMGDFLDIADNDDCSGMPAYYEKARQGNQKEDRRSVALQDLKHVSATMFTCKSSPSGLSCTGDRSASIFETQNESGCLYPGIPIESPSRDKDSDSGMMNQANSCVPIREVSISKTFLESKVERQRTPPKSSAGFQSMKNLLAKSGIDSTANQLSINSLQNSEHDIQYQQRNSRDEEADGDDIEKCQNRSRDVNDVIDKYFFPRKGRKTLAHHTSEPVEDYDDYEYLQQISEQGDYKPNDSEKRLKNAAHVRASRRTTMSKILTTKEGFNIQNNKTGAVQSYVGDDINERHSESDFVQENASCSDSDIGNKGHGDASCPRHKRRTLNEIELTRNETGNLKTGSGPPRIRKMRSVMSEGVKEARMKGSRWKKAAINDQYVCATNSRNNNEGESSGIAPNRLMAPNHDVDEHLANTDKYDQIISRRSQQGDSTTFVGKPGVRACRQMREKLRTSDRGQQRHVESFSMLKEKSVRTRKSLSWLLLSELEEGTRYIPQYGDEVVYLRQGHEEYLNMYRIDESGPWTIYEDGLHAVEFCQVVDLNYIIIPESGETCCRCTLEFSEDTSPLHGNTFQLTFPELVDFPDFIVERSRYAASMKRMWTNRDRCKVWWRSQNGQGGEWWEGRIIAVKAKSAEFPDSPWERLMVQYKSDPNKPYSHSPWELFDLNETTWQPQHIDPDTGHRLLSLLEYAASQPEDSYGLRRLKQSSCKSDFISRLPLPLTVDVIKQRLEKDYYHSPQGFYFDVQLLASNAEIYCGAEHPMAQGLQAFAREVYDEISCEL